MFSQTHYIHIASLLAQLVERYTSIKLEAQLRYVAVSRSTRLAGNNVFFGITLSADRFPRLVLALGTRYSYSVCPTIHSFAYRDSDPSHIEGHVGKSESDLSVGKIHSPALPRVAHVTESDLWRSRSISLGSRSL